MRRVMLVLWVAGAGCGRTALFDGVTSSTGGGAAGGGSGGSGGGAGGGSPQRCQPAGGAFSDAAPGGNPDLPSSMVWDEGRKVVVVAVAGEVWEWNGQGWRHQGGTPHPASRQGEALAWDGVSCRVLLFGGSVEPVPHSPDPSVPGLDETWSWDGQRWTQLHPAHVPPPRTDHAMAWDPVRQRVVLFGGQHEDRSLDDTWEWTGSDWEQAAPAASPPASATHSMAFDPVNQRVMAAGTFIAPRGNVGGQGSSLGSWEWTGHTWLMVADSSSSPPNCTHDGAMAEDPTRQELVMQCGGNPTTWIWNGRFWKPRFAVFDTLDVYGSPIAWDGARGQLMVLVNWYDRPRAPRWWDGTAWQTR